MDQVNKDIEILMTSISGKMGLAYSTFNQKMQIKFRQLMDPFLNNLVKLTDPTMNIREAQLEMLKKHG